MREVDIKLMVAAQLNSFEQCRSLINQGANVNAVITEEGLVDVQNMLNSLPDRTYIDDDQDHAIFEGFTPIMALAAGGGNYEPDDLRVFDLFVGNGADLNYQSPVKPFPTTIMIATGKGFSQLTRKLIDHGADVNATNFYGSTAFSSLGSFYETRDYDHLSNKIDCARIMIDHVSNIDHQCADGWTAFSTIIEHCSDYNLSCNDIEFLIEKGVNPTLKINGRKSAYHYLLEIKDDYDIEDDFFGMVKDYHLSFMENKRLNAIIENTDNAQSIQF